jgi:hypothetical protein
VSAETIACPSCGHKIPLSDALRAEIESSLRTEFDARERALRQDLEKRRAQEFARLQHDAAERAERRLAQELASLKDQVDEQRKEIDERRRVELDLRRRERELERERADLDITMARRLTEDREKLVEETHARLLEEHRLKDAEKDRQLTEMRRQIADLKRRAEQGSQQLQGEAGESELESTLRTSFPMDDVQGIAQGLRGADIHQIVVDARGARCGAILWECKNAKNWSDAWIAKLKEDQRAWRADVAVLVTAALPKGCARFTLIDGVLVTDFTCAGALGGVVRANLLALAQARNAASTKEEALELLYRYLSGVEFRQRVEAVVDAFTTMKADLDQERRAAERQWARRAKQLEAVTFNVAGMYGDLQGLVPALPPIPLLELPADDSAADERAGAVSCVRTLNRRY